jgi:phosphatidylinositol alpha-1,6-mannosyltransferase
MSDPAGRANANGASLSVAVFTSDFPPGAVAGIGQWAYGVTQGLCRLGHRVTVFAQRSSVRRRAMHEGAPYRVVAMGDLEWRTFRSTYAAYHAARVAFSRRFDVLIATHWALSPGAVWISQWYPLKTVVVTHGTEVGRKMNFLEFRRFRYAVTNASLTLSVSRFTKQKILDRLKIADDGVAWIPCGLNIERFQGSPDVSDLRQRFGLTGGPVILTVARLSEKKGHDVVIRALPRILQRFPDAKYLIAGRGTPESVTRLKGIAESCGVSNHVVFTGFLESADIPRIYHLCDVFVMVTRELGGKFEGFGISFLEANACGKPIVGGRSGGIPDAVLEGQTGFLVDPTSEAEVAEKVNLLFGDPELRRKMGETGRRRVEAELTWTRIAERIINGVR